MIESRSDKGFTLIELLVVVAIIGVLAAVGVVAFNGFIASAKKNAVISHHNNVVTYIRTELMKCNLGSQTEVYTNTTTQYGNCLTMTFKDIFDGIVWYAETQDVKGWDNPLGNHPNHTNTTGVNKEAECQPAHLEIYYGMTQCGVYQGYGRCCTRWNGDDDGFIITRINNILE